MSMESTPYRVSDNTTSVVNPSIIPNTSPICMYYDFYEDDKNVDKRKTSSDDLNRKDPKVVKKLHNRKPTNN